jgi:hypothetical protein
MSNSNDFPADLKLAEALRSLPVPELSADFDDCILAALRVPVPWWRRVWQPLQPLLLGTSCSLMLTLLLLHLTLSAPVSAPAFSPAALPNLAVNPRPMPPLDALLDRPNLCAGSLAAAWNSSPVSDEEEARPEKAYRRPEPRRRAAVSCRSSLMA